MDRRKKFKGYIKPPRVTTENSFITVELASHKVPEFKEVKNKDWIYYGEDNKYPDYLLDLFNRSAIHKAIVSKKVSYIVGRGFSVDSLGLTTERKALIESFIKKINPNEDANEVLAKVATDYEVFRGLAINCVPSKAGDLKIAAVYHIPFHKLRVSKEGDKIFYSDDWTKSKQSSEATGLKEYLPYNSDTKSGLIYYKQYSPGAEYYPIPDYIGAIPHIEIDIEIGTFHLNNIKHSFTAGTVINFPSGEPTIEEQGKIEKKITSKFSGTDSKNKIMITFSDGKEKAPTIEHLTSSTMDKMYETLAQTAEQRIFTGHNVTSPMLFGVKTEGQLGGRTELREASELFQNTYATPIQDVHISIFNYILSENGFEKRLNIVKTEPIGFEFSEQTLVSALTKDELRERLGLPPLGVQQMKSHATHEDSEIDVFKSIGSPRSSFRIIHSKEVKFNDQKDAIISELSLYRRGFKEIVGVTNLDRSILDLISKNDKIDLNEISEALKEDLEVIVKRIGILREKKLISGEAGKSLEVSDQGKEIIEEEAPATEVIEIMYSYEVRDGVGPEVIDTTRDFCKKLIELDRLYSRQDIETISNRVGRDVWRSRGGFYHDPKTDVTTEYCRHIWKQNIVRRKNG
jgi:hypothetical protein